MDGGTPDRGCDVIMTASRADATDPQTPRRKRSLRRFLTRWILRAALLLILLPPVLTVIYAVLPPVSTLMIGRAGHGRWIDRDYVPLEAISPHLIRSVVASEDARFCTHQGVDWEAFGGQLEAFGAGERARGASTITMQVAKNLFLWGDRSYVRKALELPLAVMIDAMLTKERILEIYLNIAEWGEGIFGAEAAAQAWYGKSATALGRTEAARLATALPNPLARTPARPSAGHERLARTNRARAGQIDPHLTCLPETLLER